jgi:squalene synthase HpnD/squalene synthase HpnC
MTVTTAMTDATALRSGKSHRDENFPVASRLIEKRHRGIILAFYEFVRTADDIADHPKLSAQDKLTALDRLEATLRGQRDDEPVGVALRAALEARGLDAQHALDLLTAFRRDVRQLRYRDWDELIDYCRYSAMPVGRFVLDVHGESRDVWPASDAICAALQIINHLQDCAKDYRQFDRVYLPLDALAAAGTGVEALGDAKASPALRQCLTGLAARTDALLRNGAHLPRLVANARLALEIGAIVRLAARLTRLLRRRDPLSEPVHLPAGGMAAWSLLGALEGAAQRWPRRQDDNGAADEDALADAPAAGSSFNTAMRILPRDQRRAMFAIYAFCRAVDDLADRSGDREDRLAELDGWRRDIDALYAGNAPARPHSLADAVRRYELDRADFMAVIDGMEMDIRTDIRAPDQRILDLYCDRVASAVGRLAVRVFGLEGADGVLLAHHLGRALQLTNILRDLDEDGAIGRLYLPREALDRAGIAGSDPRGVLADRNIGVACAAVAETAEAHFSEAEAVMQRAPRRCVRAPQIMAGVYRSLLQSLLARGWAPPRHEIHVPKARLVGIVLRHAVI